MSSASPDEGDPTPGPADGSRIPRLDAEGMVVQDGATRTDDLPPQRAPSPWPPGLVAGLALVAVVLAVVELVRSVPQEGQVRPMVPLVLAAAAALGGFSLVRLGQLLALARSRAHRRERGAPLPPLAWSLTQEHAMHGTWLVGVGASVALMGALGLWSLLDGRPSGLEPGWPLLVCGGAVAVLGDRLRRRTEKLWEESGDAF